jgi:hypothetical protein
MASQSQEKEVARKIVLQYAPEETAFFEMIWNEVFRDPGLADDEADHR